MLNYNSIAKILIIAWPLIVTIQATFYRRKQNGLNPWTGGPISWPKAFWLAYTIYTWFFLPLIFLTVKSLGFEIKCLLLFHLLSWWTRGLLELIMIYKWFNWTPRYGIGHDIFHWMGISFILLYFRNYFLSLNWGSFELLVVIFYLFILFTTIAEIYFALSFLKLRTEQERMENIYFASDDPKWIRINRDTLIVVILAFIHLLFNSIYVFKMLNNV